MMAAEGAVGGEDKESPMDFVLWKAAKPGEPSWESPWGQGRPGWHIECSAMSMKYLGDTLDIHGGGQDLVFPHHENEIVQSESFTGAKPFVKYWLHNGLVNLGENKMSKSLGNLITIKEALDKYSADALRIFVLGSYYRSPLTYSEEGLEAAEEGIERLRRVISKTENSTSSLEAVDAEAYRQRFIDAMDDDFNTAQALAALFDLARDINRAKDDGYSVAQAQQTLLELAGILGLTLKTPEMPPLDVASLQELAIYIHKRLHTDLFPQGLPPRFKPIDEIWNKIVKPSITLDAEQLVETLGSTRDQLRQAKQWQLADEIRTKLGELGITLEDTPEGTVWRRKR
jgi:cysteinyl-tRNA synthetase